jgi:tetratricopeptide (TPR) repeat protein
MGAAKTLKALEMKIPEKIEKENPQRFTYPIEIDNSSRLKNEVTRGLDDPSDDIRELLISAQRNFETAIRLDVNYVKGYVNLSTTLDLLGNYPKAIGTILELPKEQQTTEAKRILAIAYFHNNQTELAEKVWRELKM